MSALPLIRGLAALGSFAVCACSHESPPPAAAAPAEVAMQALFSLARFQLPFAEIWAGAAAGRATMAARAIKGFIIAASSGPLARLPACRIQQSGQEVGCRRKEKG